MAMLLFMRKGCVMTPCLFNAENLSPENYENLILNNPEWLLFHCRAGGYRIEKVNKSLKVTPLHAIDDDMRQLLKHHQARIIHLLEGENDEY